MDDQKRVRDIARPMLIYLGYEVEFARDGTEAVEIYKKEKESGHCFDLLDLTIPGGMGARNYSKIACNKSQSHSDRFKRVFE